MTTTSEPSAVPSPAPDADAALAHHGTIGLAPASALYVAAVKANKPVYSLTGIIPAAGMKSAADMLLAFDEEIKGANVDLAKTFDDRFVKRAAAGQ